MWQGGGDQAQDALMCHSGEGVRGRVVEGGEGEGRAGWISEYHRIIASKASA